MFVYFQSNFKPLTLICIFVKKDIWGDIDKQKQQVSSQDKIAAQLDNKANR